MFPAQYRFSGTVTLIAALVYGLTLCWGTTTNSFGLTANLAGWDWQPLLNQPVVWLVTLPLRVLPAAWIPASLNIFLALVAALTLGLVARSVELLPWECQPPAKDPWIKKLPVLLACGVCGFELNFWQEATAGSGVVMDQLLLTSAVWCLLEFRASKVLRWLEVAVIIWGLGLAQNWVMLINLPLFTAAVIWLRGKRFLNTAFFVRMFLFGLAGFSLYALPPTIIGLSPHSPLGFCDAWLATLKGTKSTLAFIYGEFWARQRLMTMTVILFFLVPTLPAILRPTAGGLKNKSQLDRSQILIFRAVLAALLLACLWLAFEPTVGLHQILQNKFEVFLPLLSFDFVNALGIAFLTGNLIFALLVPPERGDLRGFAKKINSKLQPRLPVLFSVFFGVIVLALIVRNGPAIWAANRQPLEKFGTLAVTSLPTGGGIVLCDDPLKLVAVQAALAQTPNRNWQAVLLPLLPSLEYRNALERQQPRGWISDLSRHELKLPEQFRLFERLALTNRIFFLQPEPGQLLFEQFYPQKSAAVAELKLYQPLQSSGPPLSTRTLDDGEKFWDDAWRKNMASLCPPNSQPPDFWTRLAKNLSTRFYLPPINLQQPILFRQWYSISLNDWGVELQRSGRLSPARHRFEQALLLNSNNLLAAVNLECNTNLQAGNKLSLARLGALDAQFSGLGKFNQLINNSGPMDEPALCYLLGRYCQLAGMPRQAIQQLERSQTLSPSALAPGFALAEIFSQYRQDDKVLGIVKRLRATLAALSEKDEQATMKVDLLEASSWMSQTNATNARRIWQSMLARHPDDPAAANLILNAVMKYGDYRVALQLVTNQLANQPTNTQLMNVQAGILIQMNRAADAVSVLKQALTMTNTPTLRLNLAFAYLSETNLPAAAIEYRLLETNPPDIFIVHYGLASIAEQQHDTNLAIHHLEICLTNSPAGSPHSEEILAHLAALKPPAPPEKIK